MEISKQNYLVHLNKNQKEAIIDLEGPCLIVAGAGSGKTRVLTSRVVHIIKEKKAWPNQILCVTFTNKAAREMQNRIANFLKEKQTSIPWLGTFHSVSAKLLRRHAEAVGLNSRFTIIDQEDQLRLIKNICKAENIDIKKIAPQFILAFINQWKNKGLLPKDVVVKKGLLLENAILKVYKFYQERLKILNSCDFGDLILHCVTMFENNSDILELYLQNFKYILVDEYQDSNHIQSKWLNLLAKKNNNIRREIDLKKEKKVTSELFGGFSDYIVYEGLNLKGWPVKTIVRGEVVADNFEVIGKLGHGKLVERKI